MKGISFAFVLALVIASQSVNAQPLPCYQNICAAYSGADVIFSGILTEKVYKESSSSIYDFINTFKISKTFKGRTKDIVQVRFWGNMECSGEFEVGKEYFVYAKNPKEGTILFASLHPRTTLLKYAKDDLKYINELSTGNPVFFVEGAVYAIPIPPEDLQQIKVSVQNGKSLIPLKINSFGEYQYKLTENRKVTVIIEIPFKVGGIYAGGFTIMPESSAFAPNIKIQYDAYFSPNACNYREILFDKVSK